MERLQINLRESQARSDRIRLLSDPVTAWRDTVGYPDSSLRMSVDFCRLRRKADRGTNLDDDGTINQAKIAAEEKKQQQAAFTLDKNDTVSPCYLSARSSRKSDVVTDLRPVP